MRKALFLDRDGVVNEDSGFVYTPEKCVFVDGIFELCLHARQLDYRIIIVTNQSGIARGYYTENDFWAFTEWMHAEFIANGVAITQTYFCPHHPTEGVGVYKTECICRKPAPGMILQAAREHDINLAHSIFIGDRTTDIEAAKVAGVGKAILLKQSLSSVIPAQGGDGGAEIYNSLRHIEAAWKTVRW